MGRPALNCRLSCITCFKILYFYSEGGRRSFASFS